MANSREESTLLRRSLFFEQVGVGPREAAFQVIEVAAFPESTDRAFMPTPVAGGDRCAIELLRATLIHQVIPFFTRIHDAPLVEELAGTLQSGQFFPGNFVRRSGGIVQGVRPVEPFSREEPVVTAVISDFLEQFDAFGGAAKLLQRAGLPVRAHLVVRIGVRQFLGSLRIFCQSLSCRARRRRMCRNVSSRK